MQAVTTIGLDIAKSGACCWAIVVVSALPQKRTSRQTSR